VEKAGKDSHHHADTSAAAAATATQAGAAGTGAAPDCGSGSTQQSALLHFAADVAAGVPLDKQQAFLAWLSSRADGLAAEFLAEEAASS